ARPSSPKSIAEFLNPKLNGHLPPGSIARPDSRARPGQLEQLWKPDDNPPTSHALVPSKPRNAPETAPDTPSVRRPGPLVTIGRDSPGYAIELALGTKTLLPPAQALAGTGLHDGDAGDVAR